MIKKNVKHGVKKNEKTQPKSAVKTVLKSAIKAASKGADKVITKAAGKATPKMSQKTSSKAQQKGKSAAKKPAAAAKHEVKNKKHVQHLASKSKEKPQVKSQEQKPTVTKVVATKADATDRVKAKAVTKPVAEKASKKNLKTKKTEEVDLEDDFIPDDDIVGDEIGEYEEELKAVETLDIEVEEEIDWSAESKSSNEEDIYLTDADGNRYCRAKDCDQIAAVDGYCRFHYLLFWKRIQVRKKILADGKLEKYIEELTARYPDKFLEMIRRDLRTQKDFQAAIQELEIDESELNSDNEDEQQSFIDEVRGLGESTNMDEEEF